MTKHVHYKIFPEYFLIIEYFHGDITFEDIIEAKRLKNNMPEFNPRYNHLIDLRNATFLFNHEKINDLALFQEENKEFIKPRKSAFITSKPEHVSLAMLFSISMKNLPIEFEIFTIPRAALNWLDLWTVSESLYEEILIEMAQL